MLKIIKKGRIYLSKYIRKRIIEAIPILISISIISFLLIKLAPGDPIRAFINPKMKPSDIARIRHNLGLDKPIYIQYILWLKNVLKGDLGYSLINSRPISTQIIERLPATLLLMGSSLLISLVLGIIFGVISAVNKNKLIDNILSIISYIGISIPSFVRYDTNIHFFC